MSKPSVDYLNPSHRVVANSKTSVVFKPSVVSNHSPSPNPIRVVENPKPFVVPKRFIVNPKNLKSFNQSVNTFQSFLRLICAILNDGLLIPNQPSEGEADNFAWLDDALRESMKPLSPSWFIEDLETD